VCQQGGQDDEVVLLQPSTVSFKCSYGDSAVYTWYLNDAILSQFNSSTADIPIDMGFHMVKCSVLINESADCNCEDSQTINVTALGMTRHSIYVM